MASETDQIREQIAETRQHLKLHMATLEEQVMDKVNATKETVADTIDSIKSGIERVSPSYQFNEHPIVFAVGSVVAGYAAGKWVAGALAPRYDRPRLVRQAAFLPTALDNSLSSSPAPASGEWGTLKSIAAGAFLQVAGEIAKSVFPKHEGVVHQIVSDFRTKLEAGR